MSNDDYKIYALRMKQDDPGWTQKLYASLKDGEGRFGWSYVETADLNELKKRIEKGGLDSLSDKERDCWQGFLLGLKEGDYVVYINMPEWGQCTLARVTKPYYWKHDDSDFNHRFGVAPDSVFSFKRNDHLVYPSLRARLKLQRRWWSIRNHHQMFEALIGGLKANKGGQKHTPDTQRALLQTEIKPLLTKVTESIHKTHPNKDLEILIAEIFKNVPGVTEVEKTGGPKDRGADLLVHFEVAMPVPEQLTCVVQVKSFEGEHRNTGAVDDIERAFEAYPEAAMGMIVSTASSTEELEQAVGKLREKTRKPISLLAGEDLAAFVLRYDIWRLT